MKKYFLFIFLLHHLFFTAQKDSASLRDQVLDNVIAVTFDAADMRSQLNRFEDEAAIKLHFRVADETLNELGGLSKHLFKIYQRITTTDPEANKTLTGYFSSSENGQLSRQLSYASHASADLSACLMPPQDLQVLDSAALVYFSKSLVSATDLDETPEYIHDFLKHSIYQYGTIYSAHANSCDSASTKKSQYTEFLINSRLERSRDWRLQTEVLSEALEIIQRTQVPRSTTASSQTTLSDKVKHVGTLNGSLTQCALTDLQVQGQILYQHTGIHQYLLTADVNFLIPLDSMQLFVDQVSQKLFSENPSEKYIILLWLRLAGSSAHPYNCLLMAQNGAHINRGDVNFARYNYGTKYKAATSLIYNSIYKQIKKPLIICYQTLKANGLITTTFLRKPELVKGFGQIYVHSFKYDAQLVRLNALEEEIESELAVDHFECKTCPYADRAAMMAERRQLLSSAILKPQLLEAKLHFKQAYLCDLTNARWAVWDWSTKTFPKIFYKTISESFSDYLDGKRSYTEGTCDVEPDLVMDALSVSSLLLSPVNLDFIPDAMAVTYCLAKRRYQDAAMNSLSVLIPGSLYASKRLLANTSEVVTAINKGAHIVNENGVYKAIDAEQDLLAQCYDLAPEDLQKLPARLKDDLVLTRELLPTNSFQSQMIANVNELPKEKRLEFLKECSENSSLRQRCAAEPEHVWRWAGKTFFNKSEIEKLPGFVDNIDGYLKEYNWKVVDFQTVQKIQAPYLTDIQATVIQGIRRKIILPNSNTLLQKVISSENIGKYTSGTYSTIVGCISTASDAKHLLTVEDIYFGLRLDYPNSQFYASQKSVGIIRFKAENINLKIPELTSDKINTPLTGTGFTGGINGRLGVPEWEQKQGLHFEAAELYEKFADGSEVLIARFSKSQNRFILEH